MPVIRKDDVPLQPFTGGATYQTLVGDDAGSTPIRVGFQDSPPGYATPTHSHPYVEVLVVVEGTGEAWLEDESDPIAMGPGTTLVLPAGKKHGFRVTGAAPLRLYGIHASPNRIVNVYDATGQARRGTREETG
jgi:mannose-6-phosphate isomerase-like protein (cupin superfamily)